MIASLSGQIVYVGPTWLVLETGGVGYQVFVPSQLSAQVGQPLRLYCSHQVREDSESLYGFASWGERELFEQLLSVSGVGPKSALAILGIGSIDRIQMAILQGEPALFESVSGIGKKAAAKIIVELKTKIGGSGSLLPESEGAGELVEALEALGYNRAEILPLLRDLPKEHISIQEQIRWALKQLTKRS